MLLVIMTRSLIRIGNTIRTRLDSNCITNRHDGRQWNDNDDAMTETDKGITRDYDSITRSYRREREGVGTNTNNDDITRGYRDYNEKL